MAPAGTVGGIVAGLVGEFLEISCAFPETAPSGFVGAGARQHGSVRNLGSSPVHLVPN
jgi:hypothetical protein